MPDPAEVLRQALAAVQAAELPPDLREVGFVKAIEMLTAGEPSATAASPTVGPTPGRGSTAAGPGPAVSQQGTSALALELGISDEQVRQLFDEHEGTLQFVGDLEALGSTRPARATALALLMVTAFGAGTRAPVPDTVVRAEVERHGLYDQDNYSRNVVRPIKRDVNVNGRGTAATYKVKPSGKRKAKAIAVGLVSSRA